MNCPFCMSDLNQGAVVCSHCGATEVRTLTFLGMVLIVPAALWAMVWIVIGFSSSGLLTNDN